MLYPLSYGAALLPFYRVSPLKSPRLVYRTRFAISYSDQPRPSCYPELDLP